jgi:hypothetical protein
MQQRQHQQQHPHVEELLRIHIHAAIEAPAAAATAAPPAATNVCRRAVLPPVSVVVAALSGVGQAGESLGDSCRQQAGGGRSRGGRAGREGLCPGFGIPATLL